MNPTATALALRAYGLSEKLWGLQPTRIDAGEFLQDLEEHITEALAAERERCARVAETKVKRASFIKGTPPNVEVYKWSDGPEIAAAIRARGR